MELTGHTSAETARVVGDYPYGFRLRTSIRYWVETKPGHGQRMMAQTLNPKSRQWNKAKASIYSDVTALVLTAAGHVETFSLSGYSRTEAIDAFEAECPEAATAPYGREAIRYLRARIRASEHLTYSVHVCQPGCTEPHQTLKEQAQIIGRVVTHELWQDTLAAIRGEA